MERDPHQLIEGVLIACYAVGCAQAFLYVRGEMALAQERIAQALNDAYAKGYVGKNILGLRLLGRRRPALGRRRLHRGRGDRPHREPRGQPGHAPPEAAVLPGGQGPLPPAHDRQQRRDAVANLPWIVRNGGDAFAELGRRDQPGHPHVRGVRPRQEARRLRGRVRRHHLPRPALRPRLRRRHPRRQRAQGASSPAAPRRPWFFEEHLDLPLETGAVGKAGSMLGSGAIVVMDETTDMVKAALAGRALLRPRVLRQVHALPRGHQLAGEDPRAHPRRPRPPERPRPAARRLRQHQPRHRLAARSRPPSARSARRRCRPSSRPSTASATSSRPTSAAAPSPSTTVPVSSPGERRRPDARRPRR